MREYDQVDLELLKRSPTRWSRHEYREMGDVEYDLRMRERGNRGTGYIHKMHMLIRAAMNAYEREGGECPWEPSMTDASYNRVGPDDDLLPVQVRVIEIPTSPEESPTNLADMIVEYLRANGRTRKSDLDAVFTARRYKAASIATTLHVLKGDGRIVSAGFGIYNVPVKERGAIA